jgi:hypothetical protein
VTWGNASVEAWENVSVVARGNASVVARGKASVEAWENTHVVAWENVSVVARGNASVVARGNVSVVARGNASVEAWENASVAARGNVGVWLYSDFATVSLFLFSVCWQLSKGKINKKSKTCTVISPKYESGISGWLEKEAIKDSIKVVVYKKVSIDFKTQENTKNETLWNVGTSVKLNDYSPEKGECGAGKFHACSRPYFCDEFRNEKNDKYIAIEVKKSNLYAWPNPSYPHKIAFGEGKVLYECNKLGKKIN